MFGNPSKPSRRFTYGCFAPTSGAESVNDQMHLAHRYRNKLVEIELKRRTAVRAELRKYPGMADAQDAYAEALTNLTALRQEIDDRRQEARSGQVDTLDLEKAAKMAEKMERAAKKTVATLKALALEVPEIEAALEAFDAEAKADTKKARSECGLYWGTYLTVEQGMGRARSNKRDPRFRSYDGSGSLAVQVQGGMGVPDLFKDDNRVQANSVPDAAWNKRVPLSERRKLRHTAVRIRVGSDGRAPIWAEFPIIMHRPLPAGSRIKWVHLVRKRVGTQIRHEAQFTVELPDSWCKTDNGRTEAVGIDVGWRVVKEGLRVAYWHDSKGEHDQLVLGPEILSQFEKADDLQSIQKKSFNLVQAQFSAWLKAQESVPEWLAAATKTMYAWKSPKQLAAVALQWRGERAEPKLSRERNKWLFDNRRVTDWGKIDPSEDFYWYLYAWYRQDKHLYEWETNLRDQVLRRRRELYRVFASHIAQTYGLVCIEDFDLREIVKHTKPEDGTDGNPNSRYNRKVAALSTLRGALADACSKEGAKVMKLPSQDTTRKCHVCGKVDKFDASKWVMHRCSGCGALWDQDDNSSINLVNSGIAPASGVAVAEAL